jgi:hypothetical protein
LGSVTSSGCSKAQFSSYINLITSDLDYEVWSLGDSN